MKGRIKPYQYVLIIFCFLHGSKLLLSFFDNIAKQDSWIVVILGYIASLPFLLSYVFLSKRFPDKNLIEMNDIVYGKILGRFISALYILFLLYLVSLNLRTLSDFYNVNIFPEVPSMVILIAFMICCAAFAVRFGIDAIAKTGVVIGFIILIIEAITFVLLLGDMDLSNLMPVFDQPASVYLQTTLVSAGILYCELFIILMISPEMRNKERMGRNTLLGLSVSTLLFVVIAIRNTAVLGPSASVYSQSTLQAVRMIDIGEFITRVELLIALSITVSLFYKISVLYYASVRSFSTMLNLKSFNLILIPLAAILIVYAVAVHQSTVSRQEQASNYYIMLTLPFEFILPPLTLLVAKLRRLPGGKAKNIPPLKEKGNDAVAERQPENG